LNKTELIAAIAADTNLTKADAARAFDSALEHLASCQCRGRRIGQQDGTNRVGDSRSWSSLPSGLRQHPATGANDLVR
jgi:hypothetical protein